MGLGEGRGEGEPAFLPPDLDFPFRENLATIPQMKAGLSRHSNSLPILFPPEFVFATSLKTCKDKFAVPNPLSCKDNATTVFVFATRTISPGLSQLHVRHEAVTVNVWHE